MEKLFNVLVESQKLKMLKMAQEIIPNITPDDLLQPNDYVQLENHPHFRYEEGVLEGLLSARMAYLAAIRDKKGEM